MVQRHSVDIELYYWALQQVEELKACYGARSLHDLLCAGTGTGCLRQTVRPYVLF